MKAILFAVLAVLSFNASADNYVSHKKANGSEQQYATYEAKNMDRTIDNNWMYVIYRNCNKLTAKQVIAREKLAPNANIVGGFYCGLPNATTTVLIKSIKLIKDDTVLIAQQ